MKMILESHSPEITCMIGKALGEILSKVPAAVLMTGDLGTGKTTMSQAIVEGFGIIAYVTSPTFTLINIYENDDRRFYHFDLYRLTDADELFEIGFDEMAAEKVPMIIEWPELLLDYDFDRVIRLHIEYGDAQDSRRIEIETEDPLLEKELNRFG